MVVNHPWKALAGVFAFALHMTGVLQSILIGVLSPLSPLLAPMVAMANEWFVVVSALAGTVGQNAPWIPNRVATGVLVGAGLVFGLIKLSQLIDALERRYKQ